MRTLIIGLAGLVVLLILGFIAWLTGGSFVAFFAGIFLLGFASALLAGMAGIVTLPPPVRALIGWAVTLCLIVIGLKTIKHQWDTRVAPRRAIAKAKATARAEAQAEARVQVQNRTVPVIQKVGKVPKLYKFADWDGVCTVTDTLKSDASFYPKGGTVKFTDPRGDTWEDTPGVPSSRNNTNHPVGRYKVCKKDPGAWGVEVWN